jgi:hypothetical protein
LQATLDSIQEIAAHLQKNKIRPILVFDEHMSNLSFYELVKQFNIPYPVVAPIFQKGFIQALFSEREKNSRFLLLKISGQLIGHSNSLKEYPFTHLTSD